MPKGHAKNMIRFAADDMSVDAAAAKPKPKPKAKLTRQITSVALQRQDEFAAELRLLSQYCKGGHDFFRDPSHITAFDHALKVVEVQMPRVMTEAQDDRGNTLLHNALLNAAKSDTKTPPRHAAKVGDATVEYYVLSRLAAACSKVAGALAEGAAEGGASEAEVAEARQRYKRILNDNEMSAHGLLKTLSETFRMHLKYGSSQVGKTPATEEEINSKVAAWTSEELPKIGALLA